MRAPSPLAASAFLTFLLVTATGSVSAAFPTPPIDAQLCRAARATPGATAPGYGAQVRLTDQFGATTTRISAATRLCSPAGTAGSPPTDPDTHAVRSRIRALGATPPPASLVRVETELGSFDVSLRRTVGFLAASSAQVGGAAPPPPSGAGDRYRCWSVGKEGRTALPGAGVIREVRLASGETQRLVLRGLRQVCAPTDVDTTTSERPIWHHACFAARPVAGQDPLAARSGIGVQTLLGVSSLEEGAAREVCLPARVVARCNGGAALCDRRFDRVSYATTHNAMSNQEDGFLGPNQRWALPRQLSDGIRGLMLDTHMNAGVVSLCHSFCSIGSRPLLDGLTEIREFLDRHPYEIVSIIFESYVTAADTAAVFTAAGLDRYVHSQAEGQPWPTLREMIDADRRLVVFTDSGGGTYPWYLDVWAFAFETHYSFATPADLSCTPNRGNPANSLFILNHFLTQVIGRPEYAEMVNHNPLFRDRALQCMAEDSALPNFVTVDHYQIGDVFAVVDELNAL